MAEVAGERMNRSIADFVRSCEVHLDEEQRKPNPDNALIALLCDGVRCARELADNFASEGALTRHTLNRLAQAEETRDAAQAEATRQTLLAREYKMVADAAVKDMASLRQSLEGAVTAARNV